MAEAVNLKVEMLEFFCKGIVGKQSVAIGGYPDDASNRVLRDSVPYPRSLICREWRVEES